MKKIKKPETIRSICLQTVLIPISLITLIALMLTLFYSYNVIQRTFSQELQRQNIILPLIEKSLIGDIIIDNQNAIKVTIETLENRFKLHEIRIIKSCPAKDIPSIFALSPLLESCEDLKMPEVAFTVSSYPDVFNVYLSLLFIVAISILSILTCVFIAMRMQEKLNSRIIAPIEKILSTSSVNSSPPIDRNAACEIQTIYTQFLHHKQAQKKHHETLAQMRIHESQQKIARQVAHDINSPLAALNIAIKQAHELSDIHKRVFTNTAKDISHIIETLRTQYRKDDKKKATNQPHYCLLSNALTKCIENKTIEFQHLPVDIRIIRKGVSQYAPHATIAQSLQIVSPIDRTTFGRILSNLINNAIESYDNKKATVELTLSQESELRKDGRARAIITIKDQGKGIKPQHINKVFDYGTSIDKFTGQGLGLSYAKTEIQAIGGDITVESSHKKGTTVTLSLPVLSEQDHSYCLDVFKRIDDYCHKNATPNMSICILDDQKCLHEAWRYYFREVALTLKHFHHSQALIDHIKENSRENTFFIIDYHLGDEPRKGLAIISQLKLADRSILATSDFNDAKIIKDAEFLGVKIFPKDLLS
ncbi:MAG: sensor histidine kinase [Francisellaceae bacterium]